MSLIVRNFRWSEGLGQKIPSAGAFLQQEETRRRRAQARAEDSRSAGGLTKADPMRKMPSDGSGKKPVAKKH
jgi:hypothetical protein